MAKIALCVIATNDYVEFVEPLLVSADYYFLQGHEVDYHLFTNCADRWGMEREIICHQIEHEPWPAMTLKRYHIMSGADLSGYDYVYYVDADMRFVAPVGDEIFGELVGVQHPGFYRGGGAWETNMRSEAYVFPQDRKKYLAGGFQGGTRYYNFCTYLKEGIDNDTFKGVTAVWHDESHWNSTFALVPQHFNLLDPSYCMVEEPAKRKAWGIDHLEPKIIALKKDHKKYQK
jgi:histo-blood group ABO system transferase